MPDVFAVADTLIKHIKSHYPNDIAIAAFYGSYAQGTERKKRIPLPRLIPTA